jgi:phosphate transport system substrate-binding protein
MFPSFLRQAGIGILLAFVLVMGVSLAQDTPQNTADESITVVGSRIVARIFEALVEASGVEASINVNITGTGSGLELFCAGQADVALANRPISAEEDTNCTTNAIDYIELLIGHEVLALVANPDNTFLQCLTTDQLNTLFAPSAEGQVTNWTQVSEEFSDIALTVHIPEESSVTYALLDQVVEGDGIRGDATVNEDSNAIIEAVGQDVGALGAVSLTAAQGTGDTVTILEVDSGEATGCTSPSAENVEARVYTPANRLFAYVNRASLDKAGLRDALDFAIGDEAAAVVESLGATPPTGDAYATNREILAGTEGGRQFSLEVASFTIPAGVSGQVNLGGAANGYDYIQTMTQNFNTTYPGVTINTNIEGEPAGFRRLCNGEIDIALSDSGLSEEQAQNCAANNITPLTVELGSQATVLVANAGSEFLQCLTTEQIATIWQATSADTITNWNQVSDDFPDLEMTLFAPNAGNTFTDLMLLKSAGESNVLNRIDTELDDDPLYRAAATANVAGALTYMSWPEYQQVLDNNQGNIQLVAVDGGNGCVLPSQESIADGSYPLTRPGQLIINQASLAKTEVMSFLWYLLSDENYRLLDDAGFVGVSFADLADARNLLQTAYNEAAAALQPEATAEATGEPEATAEATTEPEATVEATPDAEATEESGS